MPTQDVWSFEVRPGRAKAFMEVARRGHDRNMRMELGVVTSVRRQVNSGANSGRFVYVVTHRDWETMAAFYEQVERGEDTPIRRMLAASDPPARLATSLVREELLPPDRPRTYPDSFHTNMLLAVAPGRVESVTAELRAERERLEALGATTAFWSYVTSDRVGQVAIENAFASYPDWARFRHRLTEDERSDGPSPLARLLADGAVHVAGMFQSHTVL